MNYYWDVVINIEAAMDVTVVTRSVVMEPTRKFLRSLGIATSTCTLDELDGDALHEGTLHVFALKTPADADGFLRRFAGRQCEQQLLVVDRAVWADERGKQLMAYASVTLGVASPTASSRSSAASSPSWSTTLGLSPHRRDATLTRRDGVT